MLSWWEVNKLPIAFLSVVLLLVAIKFLAFPSVDDGFEAVDSPIAQETAKPLAPLIAASALSPAVAVLAADTEPAETTGAAQIFSLLTIIREHDATAQEPLPTGYYQVSINEQLRESHVDDVIEFTDVDGGAHTFNVTRAIETDDGNHYMSASNADTGTFMRMLLSPSGVTHGTVHLGDDSYFMENTDSGQVIISSNKAGIETLPFGNDGGVASRKEAAVPLNPPGNSASAMAQPVAPSDSGAQAASASLSVVSEVGAASALVAMEAGGSTVVTLLVMYDPGLSNPLTRIDFLVNVASEINANSGIDITFEVVGKELLSYAEDSLFAVLPILDKDASVAALREQHKADMVTFFRPFLPGTDLCGHGWIVGASGTPFNASEVKKLSFSVVTAGIQPLGGRCADATFAHEAGHNFGLQHELAFGDSATPRYVYGRGNVINGPGIPYGTVMKAAATIGDSSVLFSSPLLTDNCKGQPCGVAGVTDAVRAANQDRQMYADVFDNRPPTVPDPPTITSLTSTHNAITVNFQSGDTGRSPITSFEATCSSGPNLGTTVGSSSPIVVAGLNSNSSYLCSVVAFNSVGPSGSSPQTGISTKTQPAVPPEAPTVTSVVVEDGAIVVSFSPGGNGGAETPTADTTGFKVNCGDLTNSGPTSPITVEGAVDGTEYSCSVTALSSAGPSPRSSSVVADVKLSVLNIVLIQAALKNRGPVGTFEYKLDTGVGLSSLGCGGADAYFFEWMNQFTAAPGGRVITEIQAAFGSPPKANLASSNIIVGKQVTLKIYNDQDNDGTPNDLLPLVTATGKISDYRSDKFTNFDIPDTPVSGSFFVSIEMTVPAAGDGEFFPARLDDATSSSGGSWVRASSCGINNWRYLPSLGNTRNLMLRATANP